MSPDRLSNNVLYMNRCAWARDEANIVYHDANGACLCMTTGRCSSSSFSKARKPG